jgi:EAL domain-containing protein (putative c-di-GMP-specific phosphodiesterase class I)
MDDFGTGYSSLSCLQEYPFDVLKVDRALTENVSRGRGYSALLHAVMTLADNLGLEVVAEGIERLDQLVLLQALGCPLGQGFLLARPMEAQAFLAWACDPAVSTEAAA